MISKTFCPMPWINLYIAPSGELYPCCVNALPPFTVGNLIQHTIKEVLTGPAMNEIRRRMLAGEEVNSCQECYALERQTGNSFRTRYIENWMPSIDPAELLPSGELLELNVRYADLRISNHCNLACLTCGGELSSKLTKTRMIESRREFLIQTGVLDEDTNIISILKTKPDLFESDLKQYLDTVESVYFAGGEPFLLKITADVLRYLVEHNRTDVLLDYSSNMSVFKYKDVDYLKEWEKFDHVMVCCSIDHFGKKLEFIRPGSKHDTVFANLRKLIDHPKVTPIILPTVSVYSIYDICEYFEFLYLNGYTDGNAVLDVQWGMGEITCPSFLPDFAKTELIAKLRSDAQSDSIKKLREKFPRIETFFTQVENWIMSSTYNAKTFAMFINEVKRINKISTQPVAEALPWLGTVIDRQKML